MVQTVMTFLDETPNMDVKLSVIETLRTVTEGKVGFFYMDTVGVFFGRLLNGLTDLCRSRASPYYPYSFQHQEVSG